MIRAMVAGDIAASLALWRSSAGLVLREESDNVPALERFLERNAGLSFVAEHEGRVVASLLCGHDGRRGYLYHLAVAPEFRRRGLASALLAAVRETLSGLGLARCHVFVLPDNLDARRFWERAGAQARADLTVYTLRIGAS